MNIQTVQPTLEQAIALKQRRELDENALRTIFLEARTANAFLDAPIPRDVLERAVELSELGPTSANSLPVRYVFVESQEAKELLKPSLSAGNLDKTMKAPATAIVAADLQFYENFPRRFRPGRKCAPGSRRGARGNACVRARQRAPANGVLHRRGPRARARCRPDGWFRATARRRGLFSRRPAAFRST